MSTPKRATVYFEPAVYNALRVRALATHRSVSELVNAAVRAALVQQGAELAAVGEHKKGGRATHERLVRALKRRRLVRHRASPPRP